MHNLLYRLYRTKRALLATVLTFAGVALLFLAHGDGGTWLAALPVGDVGSALFTTGLIVVAWEYFDSQDAEERLRSAVRQEAPALRDSVIEGFNVNPGMLTKVVSPQTLDHVISNCMAARLGDVQLADDVYTDWQRQIASATEYRYDAHCTINLTPWDKGPREGLGSAFVATVRWGHRTNVLPATLRFSAVADHADYRRLLRDPASAGVRLIDPSSTGIDLTTPDVFELLQCSLNGQPLPIHERHSNTARLFTVPTDSVKIEPGADVHLSFAQRILVTQHGHQLFVDFDKPTRRLNIDFTYGNCGIRHVNLLDFITSAQQPRIQRSPATDPNPSISIGFDGWTFPRSGVAFTWVLDREVTPRSRYGVDSDTGRA